jgi:hypothetical protein
MLCSQVRNKSIFSPATPAERQENFARYWQFVQAQDGELLESTRDLANKQAILRQLQARTVRARQPYVNAADFSRNCLTLRDDPATLSPQTLLLTALYKVARHEWVGISGAWEHTPALPQARNVLDKITRYHLAEEFCHMRLFEEMFRTLHLQDVVWHPLGPWQRRMYQGFIALPGWLLYAPAFVTELMGFVFYWEADELLDTLFAQEPDVCDHLRVLLHEIMVDELAHIGLRRNFLGATAVKIARRLVAPMIRLFFRGIPESRYLLNLERMIQRGQCFDYLGLAASLVQRSWVPSYCQLPAITPAPAPAL